MTKILKGIVVFIITVLFGNHEPAFSTEPIDHLDQQNNSIATNEPSTLHFGIKGWGKLYIRYLTNKMGNPLDNIVLGPEYAIGSFIEWHPIDWFGMQTGLIYSINELTEDYTPLSLLGATQSVPTNRIEFGAVNLPLYFRFYLGEKGNSYYTEEDVLYGLIMLEKAIIII
ncbi:hypothetical protein [Candidatus Cardinium hertigii]|jgi:hypothetical protein|uniref:Uncharacterized protein n=1 Tax=Candidatus Cardinium hertigii TaxID=247481 RepID=A0A3N2QBY7_9BACT|nr:hypothetical protein [Candidatus Cardinium hertigii]ROT47328.1 hypothetical protein EDM02_02715 [Candidatus Cardinium hertigii]